MSANIGIVILFQSPPSVRKATTLLQLHLELKVFQSPPSVRKATKVDDIATYAAIISIPAFREEGDQ